MKHFFTTFFTILALSLPLGAKAYNATEKADTKAFELFKTTNLSLCSDAKPIVLDKPTRLPFQNDGMPTGTEVGIINPEGTHYPLSWKGHTWAVFQEVKFTGYCGEMVKSDDGKTVYFYNIMPDFQKYWLKGEIDAERNVVVIPNDQLLYESGGNKYYFVGMTCQLDEYGYTNPPKGEDIVQCKPTVEVPLTEDGGIDATGFFFWLWGYADLNHDAEGNPMTTDSYMSFSYSMVGKVINEEIIEAPADVEEVPYFFTELDIYYGYEWADEYGYMGAVKKAGDDVFMRGICSLSPCSYIKATSYGSLLLMPSDQVITDGRFYYTFTAIQNIREEEVTYNGYTYMDWVFDPAPSAYFAVIDDTIALAEGMGVSGDFYGSDGTRPYWYVDLKLKEYKGNETATPAELSQVNYTEWWDYGFCDFNFFFTCQDADTGEWINPHNCFYEVYFDDEPYTFTADKHELEEGDTEITQVPVLYNTSDFEPYDEFSMWQSEYMRFTMHDKDMPWAEMKIRVGYTDDEGITNYSNFSSISNRNPSKIQAVIAEEIGTEYFDLQGRRISQSPAKPGIYVEIKHLSDGTSNIQKILIK